MHLIINATNQHTMNYQHILYYKYTYTAVLIDGRYNYINRKKKAS